MPIFNTSLNILIKNIYNAKKIFEKTPLALRYLEH